MALQIAEWPWEVRLLGLCEGPRRLRATEGSCRLCGAAHAAQHTQGSMARSGNPRMFVARRRIVVLTVA
eukprot:5191732-Prymnesium_polylepis.1